MVYNCPYCRLSTAGMHEWGCPSYKFSSIWTPQITYADFAPEDIELAELGMDGYLRGLEEIEEENGA